jgi:hypothetical protein
MSLIDWSDPEEMVGLLIEFVDDEAIAAHGDRERSQFLIELARALRAVGPDFDSIGQIEMALREIHDAQPRDFAGDPVLVHVEACIEELQRIRTGNRA